MSKIIDNVLIYLKNSSPTADRLKHLENDVWARIVVERSEKPVGFLEELVAAFFPTRHRFAPAMVAAVFGIFIGLGTLKSPAPDAAEMLNFKVFKPKVIALASITPNYERL